MSRQQVGRLEFGGGDERVEGLDSRGPGHRLTEQHDIAEIGFQAQAGEFRPPAEIAAGMRGGIGAVVVIEGGQPAKLVLAQRCAGIPAGTAVEFLERFLAQRQPVAELARHQVRLARFAEQADRPAVKRPTAIGEQRPGGIVAAEDAAQEAQRTGPVAPFEIAFAADRAQLVADPGIYRRGSQSPRARPPDAFIFQRDGREESTELDRPQPISRRDRLITAGSTYSPEPNAW